VEHHPSDAKLIWNCRRGMLELDLVLARFVERHLSRLSSRERSLFEQLLDYPDPVLYALLMGQFELENNEELMHFVNTIRTQYSV
jgi:antitoxin CptB